MHCACTYTETRFACGHSGGVRSHRQCRKNLHQLMRIYDQYESGVPFRWSRSCKPDRRRNVRVKHSGQLCAGCQMETRRGWVFRGVRTGHWS